MESIAVGLLGAGEVSLRLVTTLAQARESLAATLGARIDLVALFPGDAPAPLELPEYCRLVEDPYEIVEDAAIAVMVDCGGVADSLDLNLQALERGKEGDRYGPEAVPLQVRREAPPQGLASVFRKMGA